jgi:hypothetical protein
MGQLAENPDTIVVLVHGLSSHADTMKDMADFFNSRTRVRALSVDYPSTEKPLEALGEDIWNTIKKNFEVAHARTVHFVGYSLGGMALSYALHEHDKEIDTTGKIVMLGTPNHGCPLVDYFREQHHYLFEAFLKVSHFGSTAIQQLTAGYQHPDVSEKHPVCVIAGNAEKDPHFPKAARYLKKQLEKASFPDTRHDGIVPVECTKLPRMSSHHIVDCGHTDLPHHSEVIRKTASFLGLLEEENNLPYNDTLKMPLQNEYTCLLN